MARVDLEETWTVRDSDLESVQKRLRRFLTKEKMRVIDDTDDEIRFDQGSQILTRLLGGWFVPAKWLPKTGALMLKPTKTGIRVTAHLEESLGFGLLDPLLKSKYEQFFRRWTDDVRSLFD